MRDGRDVVVWYSPGNRVVRNTFLRGRYGSHLMYSSDTIVEGNRAVGNVVGLFVMYSRNVTVRGNLLAGSAGAAGIGLGCKESGNLTVEHNLFLRDTTGVYLDTTQDEQGKPSATGDKFKGNVCFQQPTNPVAALSACNFWTDCADGYQCDRLNPVATDKVCRQLCAQGNGMQTAVPGTVMPTGAMPANQTCAGAGDPPTPGPTGAHPARAGRSRGRREPRAPCFPSIHAGRRYRRRACRARSRRASFGSFGSAS